jgi:hypothetical protein
VKQHLAAIRMLLDWLVVGQVLAMNPAASVRGPKHVVKRGKTPVLDAEQARRLLDSIDTTKLSGLRDRALIAVMVFSFARVSATVSLRVEDYYQDGKRWWFRFREKGGKLHQVPAHHTAEASLDSCLIGRPERSPCRVPVLPQPVRPLQLVQPLLAGVRPGEDCGAVAEQVLEGGQLDGRAGQFLPRLLLPCPRVHPPTGPEGRDHLVRLVASPDDLRRRLLGQGRAQPAGGQVHGRSHP